MVVAVLLLIISILLLYIGRSLWQIRQTLDKSKQQLEDYLKVVLDSSFSEEENAYAIGNEEKQMLWTMEEKEKLFNDMLQEIF